MQAQTYKQSSGKPSSIQRNIKMYDRVINNKRKSPGDKADAYYMKAGALVKLGDLVDVDEMGAYYNEALDSYNAAVNLEPENPLCLIDRAKLYSKLQMYEQAAGDISLVQKLSIGKDIEGLYVTNILNELLSLNEITSSLEQSANFGNESINADDDVGLTGVESLDIE